MFIGLGDVSGSLQIFQDVFFPESFSGSRFFQSKKKTITLDEKVGGQGHFPLPADLDLKGKNRSDHVVLVPHDEVESSWRLELCGFC